MKMFVSFSGLALLIVLCALSPASAEKIAHHGQFVEAEGIAQDCLSCHDGTQAGHVSFCTVKCNARTPHSILKPYPPKGKEALYAPIEAVTAKGIKIVDGKVTCISCHNLKNPAPAHLILDEKGRLCTICHINIKGAH